MLKKIIKTEKIEFIHSQPDPEVRFISEHRDKFPKTFLPSQEAIRIAQDKFLFSKLMEKYHIPCPKTIKVYNSSIIFDILNSNYKKYWLRAAQGAGSLAALPVVNYDLAFQWIEYWRSRGVGWNDFILSEFLPGKEYAFQSLWNKGKLVTSAARQRIEYLFQSRMPSGQSSTPTIAKSIHNKKVNDVAISAIRVLDRNASGIFCVDLKENDKGIPCVTEINVGRFFTTSLFFTQAGSNMPYYYIKLAYGEKLNKLPQINAVPKDLYWIRQIDCGYKLLKENEL
jgi:carbamoyl-phosphate synthase large subunit